MKLKEVIASCISKITGCYDIGKNNAVYIVKNGKERRCTFMPRGLKVYFYQNNSKVTIAQPLKFEDSVLYMEGDNGEFSIKSSHHKVCSAKFFVAKNAKILIGNNCQMKNTGLVMITSNTNKKPLAISVGDNVYFARDVLVRASDGHTLYDVKSKKPLNPPKNVTIEDNVWVGSRAVILKGSYISKGSVVGACSLVNKEFKEENVVLVGQPAKILKHNTTWSTYGYGNYVEKYGSELGIEE